MEYLCQVAKHRSYSEAAKDLFVSRPSLSQCIRAQEKQLGVQLFRREGRGVALTEEGELVVKYYERILSIQKQIETYFHQAARKSMPVTIVLTAIVNPLFDAMAELSYLPDLRLKQIMAHRDYLDHHPWDLMIFSTETAPGRGDAAVLKRESFCFAITADHPLAKHTDLPLSALADLPLILPSRHNEAGNIIQDIFQREGFVPNIVIESDDYFSYPQFLSQGIVGVVPSYSAGLQDERSLRLIPWRGCERSRLLCLSCNPPLSPCAEHVKEHILAYFRDV